MAGGGGKHLLVTRLLIAAIFAAVSSHPVPTQLNGMKYINKMNDKRIKTSLQDNKEDDSLFSLEIRAGEGVLGGSSGTGIVPSEFIGGIKEIQAMPLTGDNDPKKLEIADFEKATYLRSKAALPEYRSGLFGEGPRGSGDTGNEPEEPSEGMKTFSLHRVILSKDETQRKRGKRTKRDKPRGDVKDFQENRLDRVEDGSLRGNSDNRIILNDLTRGSGDFSLHRQSRSEEGGLSGTSGTGIVPDDATKIVMQFPFNHKYRSEDGGLGENGGTGIEPPAYFGSNSQVKVHPSIRWGEEGLGGNSGNGIVPDQMEERSEEGGLGGNGGTGIEPPASFESKGQFEVRRSIRWGEEGLGGNSGNGIVPDQMEERSEEGGLGGNGGTGIEPFPPFGSNGQLKVHYSNRFGEEVLGGNSGNGIVPDQMEGRSEGGGLGGSGGTGIEPPDSFESKGQLNIHRSERWGEEGLGENSGNGIVPDQMEERSEEGGLGGTGGTGIEPVSPFRSRG